MRSQPFSALRDINSWPSHHIIHQSIISRWLSESGQPQAWAQLVISATLLLLLTLQLIALASGPIRPRGKTLSESLSGESCERGTCALSCAQVHDTLTGYIKRCEHSMHWVTFNVRGSERNLVLSRQPSTTLLALQAAVTLHHANGTYSKFQQQNGTATVRFTVNDIFLWPQLRDSRGTATCHCACTCQGWGWGLHVHSAGFWKLLVVAFLPGPALRRNAVRGNMITLNEISWPG